MLASASPLKNRLHKGHRSARHVNSWPRCSKLEAVMLQLVTHSCCCGCWHRQPRAAGPLPSKQHLREDIFVPSSPGTCTATRKAGSFSHWKKTPCALENSRCLVFIRKSFCRERRMAVNSTVLHLRSHVSPCHAADCQGESASSWLLNALQY